MILGPLGYGPSTLPLRHSASDCKTSSINYVVVNFVGIVLKKILREFIMSVVAHFYADKVVVAEWLRRWNRNPLGSPRAGSNAADYVVEAVFHFEA